MFSRLSQVALCILRQSYVWPIRVRLDTTGIANALIQLADELTCINEWTNERTIMGNATAMT